jgi:Phage derived protein Gp49-like (DUF891)
MFLADRDQAGSIDEVQGLAIGELLAGRAVAGRSDHDAKGGSLVLHCAVQVADVGRLDGSGVELGLDGNFHGRDGIALVGHAVDAPGSSGASEIRIVFVFDPWRSAILLVARDKAGKWNRWYAEAIPRAERLYEIYLKERAEEETGR